MPSGRLQQQFIRLWQCCEGQSQETTLNELAELLNCSRRHMRTLLNTMQQQGWLNWEAEAGRGKRSRLTFLYTGLALQQQRAEDLLEQDRIDQLVQLVGDKAAVRQMLVSHLGRSFRQGRHILRVLYYRPMKNLLPGTALRRSETHMARQIFSGLTRINEENGNWKLILRTTGSNSPTSLALLLTSRHPLSPRPRAGNARCHRLTGACPQASALFAYFARSLPTARTLDIELSQPDKWLPGCWGMSHQ